MGLPINNSRFFRAPESSGNIWESHCALALELHAVVWLAAIQVRRAEAPGAPRGQTQSSLSWDVQYIILWCFPIAHPVPGVSGLEESLL